VWFLFHHGERTRVVPGGRSFVRDCPTCNEPTRFDEVETTERAGLFFVDVVSDKQAGFRCRVCEDVFDLRDTAEVVERQPAARAPIVRADRADALAAEQRTREADKAAREADKAAREVRIEDELAELKKRLGRT
jgi:hypothetical protein